MTEPTLRLIIRLYGNGAIVEKEEIAVPLSSLESYIELQANRHHQKLKKYQRFLIEIEFADDPSETRFVRIGTDTSMMNQPIAIPEEAA